MATPHIAGYSLQGKQRATAMMIAALNRHCGWQVPVPHITAPAQGAAAVTMDRIMDGYDIMADTRRLKACPGDFESLRNHYALRDEVE